MNEHKPILFCINNPRSLEERRMLQDAGCVSRDCIGRCARCFETRMLLVKKRPIEGDNYTDLLAQARRLMDANPERPSQPEH